MFKCPQLAPTDANRVGSALALHRLFAKRDLGEFRGPRVARVFPGSTRNIVAKCRQVMRRALSAADQPLAAVARGPPPCTTGSPSTRPMVPIQPRKNPSSRVVSPITSKTPSGWPTGIRLGVDRATANHTPSAGSTRLSSGPAQCMIATGGQRRRSYPC